MRAPPHLGMWATSSSILSECDRDSLSILKRWEPMEWKPDTMQVRYVWFPTHGRMSRRIKKARGRRLVLPRPAIQHQPVSRRPGLRTHRNNSTGTRARPASVLAAAAKYDESPPGGE